MSLSILRLHHSTLRPSLIRRLTQCRNYSSKPPDYAFAFDIDGVLLRGRTPLPGATKSLRKLQDNHVPFILLTNGGGKHESERTEELSRLLDVPITEDMFIQSHTPFKGLVGRYNSVLAVGGEEVGEGEGWKNDKIGKSGEGGVREVAERHWGPTLHIIIDLLLSARGELGTYSNTNGVEVPGKGKYQNNNQPDVWWSNNDLWWQGEYHLPRLGQGGFRAAVEGVWSKITDGEELRATTIGKPFKETYAYAESVLNNLLKKDMGEQARVKRVYMVGDNPRSDIMGANGYGWYSLLLETGVFKRDREGGEAALKDDMRPRQILKNVEAAVDFGMSRGGTS
ncbi:hypothetical protein AOL_s00079g204 [Orbilia oligospora ATCC 24927]|uniref:HAD-superfamily hydrolase n=1 Tax=Arthrobotrys oligospora (strain ATCC 24927 / CBS 115.81 / DSM 1491) TaxID=756982 RepID=G1XDA1_ARTOA|nr:hypothetical protein AOL_s00079g204 [Orbilia oligospora ATCC 24927]EGX48983.1 hypothetical protein AOL_s00079g204 [Orbilia oligospora ATCC 24927]